MAYLGEVAQLLSMQEPSQDEHLVETDDVLSMTQSVSKRQFQETADEYGRVLVQLNLVWRIIECSEQLQWIVQRRKKGGAQRPWRAVHYCRTREALLRLCTTSCGPARTKELDVLAALPPQIRSSVTHPLEKGCLCAPEGPSAPQSALDRCLPASGGPMSDLPADLGRTKRGSEDPPLGSGLRPVEEPRS